MKTKIRTTLAEQKSDHVLRQNTKKVVEFVSLFIMMNEFPTKCDEEINCSQSESRMRQEIDRMLVERVLGFGQAKSIPVVGARETNDEQPLHVRSKGTLVRFDTLVDI